MEPEPIYEKNYNGLLFTTSNEYIWPKNFFDFHAWVKKCHISLSEKLPKWHLGQMYSFEVVNNSPLQNLFIKCFWLRPSAYPSG